MAMIERAAAIGGGVIGAGWIARLCQNGIDVLVHDPSPAARSRVEAVLANASRAQGKLTMAPPGRQGRVTFAPDVATACADAELVVESVPEQLGMKQAAYAAIEAAAPAAALIASSTSGILPTQLAAELRHPERFLVAHPFNPVYLIPLVELVAGARTAPETIARATDLYRRLGMQPLPVRREIDGFIADRLLEAMWREALWLVQDEIATTAEIDDAIRYGFGLRMAQMGLFETYRIAGGEAGMRHFLAQFGPCLAWPWSKLTDVPELTPELVERIATQSDAQSGQHSIQALERQRDDNLVGILQALKATGWGAGAVLAAHERALVDAGAALAERAEDLARPLRTLARRVPPDWTDYNGHMNESRYLQCFADATDALLRRIGVDAAYVESGRSYFTVESHLRHLAEVSAGEPIEARTQVLAAAGKRLHLFHWLEHGDGQLLATGEHMLIHVSLTSRSACDPEPAVAAKAAALAAAHARLPLPSGAGRAVGQAR